MEVKFNDIRYKDRLLIKSSSIFLKSNGLYLIKAPNGAGKSTLFKELHQNYRNEICYINQDNNGVIKNLNILENISMTNDEKKMNNVKNKLMDLGLGYLLSLNPKYLSGGEKRLICILRGIFSCRNLILIDEPTNDLDYRTVEVIVNILESFKKQRRFLIITHDNRIDQIANQILQIKDRTINTETFFIKTVEKEEPQNKVSAKELESEFISKVLKRNYLQSLIILIAIAFSFSSIYSLTQRKPNIFDPMPENQLDIFIPISDIGSDLFMKGAIPLNMLNSLDNLNLFNLKNFENELDELIWNPILHFGLHIPERENYSVFALEFYNIEEQTHFYATEMLDSNNIYHNRWNPDYEELMKSESKLFLDIESQMQEMGNEVLFYTIIFNEGYDLNEFIKSHNLIGKNYVIRTNDSINLINQINTMNFNSNAIANDLIINFLIICSLAATLFLVLESEKSKLFVLFHYGFDGNIIKRKMSQKYNSLIQYGIGAIIIILMTYFILIIMKKPFLLSYWETAGSFLFALFTGYFMNKKKIKKFFKKIEGVENDKRQKKIKRTKLVFHK